MRSFEGAANQDWRWSVLLGCAGTVAVGIAAGGPGGLLWGLGWFLFGAGCGAGFSATINTDAALEPDANYIIIPEPSSPIPPFIDPNWGLGAQAADAMNAMLGNQALGLGYGAALIISLSRASGAVLAGRPDARDQQLAAARGFALEWSGVIAAAATLRTTAAQRIADLGIGMESLPFLDAMELSESIQVNGWPLEFQDMLELYGLHGDAKHELLRRSTGALNSLAGLSVPTVDIIAAVERVPNEQDLIATLHRIASR